MTDEVIVFVTLGGALALFVSDRLRLDVTALLALLALLLTGVLDVDEALAGFAAPVTVMIAALFFVGDALEQTGVAQRLAGTLTRLGSSELRLLVGCTLLSAALSAFMSSTGAVALLVPVVVDLARRAAVDPARLLLPVAFGALFGGMLTLIGTPPNLITSAALAAAAGQRFGFFAFTPVGLVMLAAGVAYLALAGRWLLRPRESTTPGGDDEAPAALPAAQLLDDYQLGAMLRAFTVPRGSPLDGVAIGDVGLYRDLGVVVLEVLDARGRPLQGEPVSAGTRLCGGGGFVARATPEAARHLVARFGVVAAQAPAGLTRDIAEVVVVPRSRLIGQSIADVGFRGRYGLGVVAVRSRGEVVADDFVRAPLRAGDTLLVQGSRDRVAGLRARRSDFVVVSTMARNDRGRPPRDPRARVTVAVLVAMVVVMALELVAPVVAAVAAAALLAVLGCVRLPAAYRSVNWESVVLIAAMLPMATALQKTGGLDRITGALTATLGDLGPLWVMAGLFATTSGLSLVMSNTATSVILAPVGVDVARELGVAPQPLLMAIAIAASTSFSTPVGSPVNTLVLGAGGYRFADYARLGLPLQLLVLLLGLLVIPWLFPW